MAARAFQMMMAGLEDAIAYARGDASRGRVARGAAAGKAEAAETRPAPAAPPRTSVD